MQLPRSLAPVVLGEAYQELRRAAGLEPDPDFDKPFDTSLQLCFAPRSRTPRETESHPFVLFACVLCTSHPVARCCSLTLFGNLKT
jgi:hypothetical protein